MVRRSLLVLALIAASNLLAPAAYMGQELDLTGIYKCEGVNPDGERYKGRVEIAKNDRTYRLVWTHSPVGTALGVGILNGDVLAVSYFNPEMVGVILYKVEKGPRLVGEWTAVGADGHVYPETLTKMGLEARHQSEPASESRSRFGVAARMRRTRPTVPIADALLGGDTSK